MEFSNLSKKLSYFSSSHYCLYSLFYQSLQPYLSLTSPPETLVATSPSPNPIFNSNECHTKPTSQLPYSLISSTWSSSFCSIACPSSQPSQSLHFSRYRGYRSQVLNPGLLKPHSHSFFRWFSASSFDASFSTTPPERITCTKSSQFENLGIDGYRSNATPKQVSEIIELIRGGEDDLESKLNVMNVSLSTASVIEIFRVLNCERVSALRFFHWLDHSQPEFCCNSDICSLVIDNCGRIDDYEAMLCLLNDFRQNGICLTQRAFWFLTVMISSEASTRKSISRVVVVLSEVGGSGYGSGIRALIEMLSVLGSFEMAKFVIKKTKRKLSYYNILIGELCRRCDFVGVRDMLDEMRQAGCDPNVQTYNYVLSSLCKKDETAEASMLLKEMQERDCPPDALTFEIFICYSCRFGKLDTAFEFLDQMVLRGLEPRLSTHAAVIKGYFNSRQYEEAYKYVVGSGAKYKCSSNLIYSLLASLHQKKGNLAMSHNILSEMIKKGLRPNFPVYMRVSKHLQKSGREDLAGDLKSKFSSLSLQSSMDSG